MRTRLRSVLVTLVAVTACAHANGAAPIDGADDHADSALAAYLDALVAGDCSTARRFADKTFVPGNGELCGDVHVDRATIDGIAATPTVHEAVFATTLTTSGSDDQTIPVGEVIWYYTLEEQTDGAWRITGGGTGP